jgi:tRNA A-37 threonylcarbamoyl transferase component Bud32
MKSKTIYLNPQWQQQLDDNQLSTFDHFWDLDLKAVDEGNVGRGHDGWSKVCIHNLTTATGEQRRIVIKRQSNYRSHTLRHPIRGIATFEKEYQFIRRYQKLEIPAMRAVYCATRQVNGELQAILVTEYLENYRSLFDILEEPELTRHDRGHLTQQVAQLVATLHEKNLEHRCLFPKHIFIPNDPTQKACLIDLEKTRWRPWGEGRRVRDLTALARRTSHVSARDKVRFMRQYFGIKCLDDDAKQLWQKIDKRITLKRNR